MLKYDIEDILANIIAQTQRYKEDLDYRHMNTVYLMEIVEYLVNETSKLKTVVLEMPGKEDNIQ